MEKRFPIIVVSSPSGGGKSCIVRELLHRVPKLELSVSATTRKKRPSETNGVEYFFISLDEFKEKLADDEFIEYEEVYEGKLYGTLFSEINRIINHGKIPLFELDVFGALTLKKKFPDCSHVIFIHPGEPILEVLEERLRNRHTEGEEDIQKRVEKAKTEITLIPRFDFRVFNRNGDLVHAINTTETIVKTIITSY